jgi:hypothetical protein
VAKYAIRPSRTKRTPKIVVNRDTVAPEKGEVGTPAVAGGATS